MNEGIKTGLFWLVAAAMLAAAIVVSWPKQYSDEKEIVPGQLLFENFTDPLAAASMRIVTFDEEQGQLANFAVAKDSATGVWTIPSRNGYPADALAQMKNAANSLVGIKILDIQTSNAEDHDDLGVVEPKLDKLQVGDEGVGRLVTFRDAADATLASLIIGDPLKDDPEKLYVRIPGQDPVYVVKLDESPLTTNFQDWIEDDLLQLSSIDIAQVEIKDYSAALNTGNQVAVTRNYAATVRSNGTQWQLASLQEFDPQNPVADPQPVEITADLNAKLSSARLDGIKNALDDLTIADVVRKPDGMSANLRAEQDLLSDQNAISSLGQRGFYPVPTGPQGEMEILSANGELSATLSDGVKYVMRFGNIAGVSDKQSGGQEEVVTGVNRYLLVTAMLDESAYPPPDLQTVPQTLEDLDTLLGNTEQPSPEAAAAEPATQLSEEERRERLEAEQEKITKENTRKLDERKDRMEAARRRVRDLNARFADWYYVIPEDTYARLRIKRDELFQSAAPAPPASGDSVNPPDPPNLLGET